MNNHVKRIRVRYIDHENIDDGGLRHLEVFYPNDEHVEENRYIALVALRKKLEERGILEFQMAED